VRRKLVWLLLLLVASAFAADSLADKLQYLLPGMIGLVIIMIALAFMVGESINSPYIINWAKGEIRELVVSAILFVIIMGAIAGSTPLVNVLTGQDDTTIDQSADHVVDDMTVRSTDAFEGLIDVYHALGMATGYSASFSAGFYVGYTTSAMPYAGFRSLMVFLGQAAGGLTNIIMVYRGMGVLLDFFGPIRNQLIFFAFALRFFPFTRQLGNTVIALLIGLAVLFPLSLVLVGEIHDHAIDMPQPAVSRADLSSMEPDFPPGAKFICGNIVLRTLVSNFGEIGFALPICIIAAIPCGLGYAACFTSCWEIVTRAVYPLITMVAIPAAWGGYVLDDIYGQIPDVTEAFVALKPFFLAVNNLAVVMVIDLLIVAIITVVGTRAVSLALGGEYLVQGLSKLV